ATTGHYVRRACSTQRPPSGGPLFRTVERDDEETAAARAERQRFRAADAVAADLAFDRPAVIVQHAPAAAARGRRRRADAAANEGAVGGEEAFVRAQDAALENLDG